MSAAKPTRPHAARAADHDALRHGMNTFDGVLVAHAPDGLEDEPLRAFQAGLLTRVHAGSPRGVVIDVSRVRLLDSSSFALLADAGRMAAMLGARVVFAGFQPGVVSALMNLDVDTESLVTAMTVEHGLELLRPAEPESGGNDPEGEDPDGAEPGGNTAQSQSGPETTAP